MCSKLFTSSRCGGTNSLYIISHLFTKIYLLRLLAGDMTKLDIAFASSGAYSKRSQDGMRDDDF